MTFKLNENTYMVGKKDRQLIDAVSHHDEQGSGANKQ